MNRIQKGIVVGVIVVGALIGASLFYLFPDMMFKGTGFERQAGTSGGPTPQATGGGGGATTTGAGSSGGQGTSS